MLWLVRYHTIFVVVLVTVVGIFSSTGVEAKSVVDGEAADIAVDNFVVVVLGFFKELEFVTTSAEKDIFWNPDLIPLSISRQLPPLILFFNPMRYNTKL